MMGATGHNGTLYVRTIWGVYQIPEKWADRRVPDLARLAEFVAGPDRAYRAQAWNVLRTLCDAPEGPERDALRERYPREDAALYHWRRVEHLQHAFDEHGPTMRQLLDSLNEAGGQSA